MNYTNKVVPIDAYPLEVQRAEQTRYRLTFIDEVADAYDDTRNSTRLVGIWMLTIGVVFFAGLFWLYVRYR